MLVEEEVEDEARLALLHALELRDYDFVTPTPATHARVLMRPRDPDRAGLRDVFGWSAPFKPDALEPPILELMRRAGVLAPAGNLLRSTIRVSRLCGRLFMHSAYPTIDEDAVFLGPDSYRFARFIQAELQSGDAHGWIADVCAGAGVGAVVAAERRPNARFILTDVNPKALRLARINAVHAGVQIETVQTHGLDGVEPRFDVAVANPPFIIDPSGRAYRHGGDMYGGRLSLDLTQDILARLTPGGRLLLYTGAAVVQGRIPLGEALLTMADGTGAQLHIEELDPDVFGEELDLPAYADVERIAVIGAVLVVPRWPAPFDRRSRSNR